MNNKSNHSLKMAKFGGVDQRIEILGAVTCKNNGSK